MNIAENTNEGLSLQTNITADVWPVPTRSIAPWWHTTFLVAFLVAVSVLSSMESKAKGFGGGHIKRYLFGMAWEWVLAALVWWGIRMRHIPVRQLLGQRRSGWKEWARDFAVAMGFWIMATIILAAIATVLKLVHLVTLQKAAIELAPQNGAELAVWLVLCATAGMVEEFVFRGYLLQQFASIGGRLWLGVVVSSLLFGSSHGYEGIGGMIAITAYGAMFCILTVKRKSLRAGMMSHAWHDSITGIVLMIVKHLHLI
jgi:membrane protease YdiL (CAAX protease family)